MMYLQRILQVLINFHDCSLVTASVAVVGCYDCQQMHHEPVLVAQT
jgi:hypothetical protein